LNKVAGSYCTWLNFDMSFEGRTQGGFMMLRLENLSSVCCFLLHA